MQTEMRNRTRNIEIDDAGLNYGKAIDRIDFEYLTHARQLDDDPLVHCERAAGKSGAGAAGRKWNLLACEQRQNFRYLRSRIGKHHCAWRMLMLRQAIAFVDQQFVWLRAYRLVADDRAQLFGECIQVGQPRLFR
jgi:hypothetical protein